MGTARPHFLICAATAASQAELPVKPSYVLAPAEARRQIGLMQESLRLAQIDFDIVFVDTKTGAQPVKEALDKATNYRGFVFGFALRGSPEPDVAVLLEEIVALIRTHPSDLPIVFNWDIPSTLDACKRVLARE
ncbi:Hypothetical protein D9617_25g062060 [Elsinoe fawcettii]|nr:Hypothetical protein D9617_25g062060 [Elsinoe fawcettii]